MSSSSAHVQAEKPIVYLQLRPKTEWEDAEWIEAEVCGGFEDGYFDAQCERILAYLPLFSCPMKFYWHGQWISGPPEGRDPIVLLYQLETYCSLTMRRDLLFLLTNHHAVRPPEEPDFEAFLEECLLSNELRTVFLSAMLQVFEPGKSAPYSLKGKNGLLRELFQRIWADEYFSTMLAWCVLKPGKKIE